MISTKLREYLDKNNVEYNVSPHREAFTAQEIAACMHVPGKVLAKVVMVKAGEKDAMVVMPACRRLNMDKLKTIMGSEDVRLENEDEFKDKFPECDVGAMPPFGNLYDIDVYVDSTLADDEQIIIPSGNYTECVRLKYRDFADLAKPKEADFSVQAA